MNKKCSSLIFLLFFCTAAFAQETDNYSEAKTISRGSFFRILYDNDLFTGTDDYYTQGITLEYVNPVISRFFPAKLLRKPFRGSAQAGVSINHLAYTPTSILSDSILRGDRPFHADFFASVFTSVTNRKQTSLAGAAFSIGVSGPAAFGKEMQQAIHRWFHYHQPRGWQFQTGNTIILNYRLSEEKQLYRAGNAFRLNAAADLRIGTLNDKLTTGFDYMAGKIRRNFFLLPANGKGAEYYFFGKSMVNLVGYDGSLQGGLFSRHNPYVISAANISRVVFQQDVGICINLRKFYLSYSQTFLTREFITGMAHRWMSLNIGFSI